MFEHIIKKIDESKNNLSIAGRNNIELVFSFKNHLDACNFKQYLYHPDESIKLDLEEERSLYSIKVSISTKMSVKEISNYIYTFEVIALEYNGSYSTFNILGS